MLPGAAKQRPGRDSKRVVILHSFGRDFRPWGEYAKTIREDLDRLSPWHLEIECKSASHLTPNRLPTLTPAMALEVIATAKGINGWPGSR
jgi:hypothetical protein